MTRKALLIVAVVAGVMVIPGLFQDPAVAGIHWSVGTGFSVGGLDFNVVFGVPFGYFAEQTFYRTHRSLHYAGYRCHGACSFHDGYYYHHRDCPLIGHHFRSYGYAPGADWWITPRLYDRGWRSSTSYRSYRYRYDPYRYDRYRYDRYRDHRSRYDRRYSDRYRSDRHRYDGHRRDWRPSREDQRDRDPDRYDGRRPQRNRGGFDHERDHRNDGRHGAATRRPR